MGRLSPADFHAVYGFRRPNVTPLEGSRQVCGLDYPFTLLRNIRSFRCCPSSLYTFPAGIYDRAWLGIAISGFPDFEQFCIAGFPGEHSSFP